MAASLNLAYRASLIIRSPDGDLCVLCNKVMVNLPLDHEHASPMRPLGQGGEPEPPGPLHELVGPRPRRTPPAARGPLSREQVKGRLGGILRTLECAQEGQRNAVLYWAACRVADMLAAGDLTDEALAVDTMTSIAVGLGLTHGEVARTINSGLNGGPR